MLPPQIPPHRTDHLRYPDSLEPGFEKKYPDPYDPAPRCSSLGCWCPRTVSSWFPPNRICQLPVYDQWAALLHRVVIAVERNIKVAKDKLPPCAQIVSKVVDVREILNELSSKSHANEHSAPNEQLRTTPEAVDRLDDAEISQDNSK